MQFTLANRSINAGAYQSACPVCKTHCSQVHILSHSLECLHLPLCKEGASHLRGAHRARWCMVDSLRNTKIHFTKCHYNFNHVEEYYLTYMRVIESTGHQTLSSPEIPSSRRVPTITSEI